MRQAMTKSGNNPDPLIHSLICLLLLPVVLLAACSPAEIKRTIAMDKVLAEARTRTAASVRQNPRVFKSADVRSENGDTLVIEYVVTPEAESRVQQMHNEYLTELRANEQYRKDFLRVADLGISSRVIYKSGTGELLLEDTLTRETLD
jgi:hypothetical protein